MFFSAPQFRRPCRYCVIFLAEWIFDDEENTLTNKNYVINVPQNWQVPLGSGYLASLYVLDLDGREVIEKKFEKDVSIGHVWRSETSTGEPCQVTCTGCTNIKRAPLFFISKKR